jgi:hypothetical protein
VTPCSSPNQAGASLPHWPLAGGGRRPRYGAQPNALLTPEIRHLSILATRYSTAVDSRVDLCFSSPMAELVEPPEPLCDDPSPTAERELRRAALREAIEAYRERWHLSPVRDWDKQLEWCDRVHATASRFHASKPAPGEIAEPKFRLPSNPRSAP